MPGYTYCACRDCFETVIGEAGVTFCGDCEAAGCEPNAECGADHCESCGEYAIDGAAGCAGCEYGSGWTAEVAK